ncbi:MAG: hypothetical protein IRZ19_09965 [Pyrinomonas methylaliphatogenes]|nr:hypothetical protein [Pyrinomonas methylaliphatogenes]
MSLSSRNILLPILFLISSLGVASNVQVGGRSSLADALPSLSEQLLRETSEIRQLKILRPVPSSVQSRAEIERMLAHHLDEQDPPQVNRATNLFLKRLGLAPPNFDYRSFMLKLLTDQVVGYYDPEQRRFFIADWVDIAGRKPVIVHELTHSLQDQHFDLRRFERWPKDESDAKLAAQALIEGDATLVMTFYLWRNPGQIFALLKTFGNGLGMEAIGSAPRAIAESLKFPYIEGSAWVRELHRRGGWELVSRAYSDLPRSTEQILHPEKYFARELPVEVKIADVSPLLGGEWKRIASDVCGEWGLALILGEFLPEDLTARAAAGWGGDRYALYEGPNGQTAILIITVWDAEPDAREFFDAYSQRVIKRYADNEEVIERLTADGAYRLWRTGEGLVWLERRATSVIIFEGAPRDLDWHRLPGRRWASFQPPRAN